MIQRNFLFKLLFSKSLTKSILRLLFSLKPKEMAKIRFLTIWIDQK